MNNREQLERIDTCICRLTQLYGEWAKRHGMSYNSMVVLDCLNRKDGCTQKEIAEEWMIPKQTVNTIVKELERKGYVCYGPAEGKKEKNVFFTGEGKVYASECLKGMYEMEERAFVRIGEEMQRALVNSNLAYVQAFEEELRDEG